MKTRPCEVCGEDVEVCPQEDDHLYPPLYDLTFCDVCNSKEQHGNRILGS